MKKYLTIFFTFYLIIFDSFLFCYEGEGEDSKKSIIDSSNYINEEIDDETKKIIKEVVAISEKYINIKKEELLKDKDLIFHEQKGNSEIIKIENKTESLEYNFIQDKLHSLRYRDNNNNGFDLSFYENGKLSNYVTYKGGKLDGFMIKFYKNGKLQSITYFKDFKLFGKAKSWDNKGKLKEVKEYKKPTTMIIAK